LFTYVRKSSDQLQREKHHTNDSSPAVVSPFMVIFIYSMQGWVFAMAKTIFAGTVEKTGKNRGKN